MNENLNLVEILKDCPSGTKLYSTVFGEVELVEIKKGYLQPIGLRCLDGDWMYIGVDGRLFPSYDGECTLFPSRTQRDWAKFERFWDKPKVEKFDPKTLNPYEKVLVKYSLDCDFDWECDLFSHIDNKDDEFPYHCVGINYRYCIPYNNETKHLVGTNKEAPEYYRYWEE